MPKNKFFLVAVLLSGIFSNSFAQYSKVWASISDPDNVPYLSSDNQLVSNDPTFNQYIQSLQIISCKKALPSSRKKELQQVYELTASVSTEALKSGLANNVSAVSDVYRAPVYDTLHTPNDYNSIPYVNNYALNLINAQQAWDLTQGDSTVVISISDLGYDSLHSELAGKFVHFFSGSNMTTHGNTVAILAAGKTNNNNGLSSIGYNCKLGLYAIGYNEVINAAYAGARIINMSWASNCFYNPLEQQCIDEAYEAGAFLVAAAGNGNTCTYPSNYVYPAAYNHVFAVTSIGAADNHEQIPNDSTSTHQHNDMVDLSAPGYDVAINPSEGWYLNFSGTSFAAPLVSGTIGLMLSVNPCLSRLDIDTILKLSSVDIDSLNPNYAGKLGAGRLNSFAAVQMASGWTPSPMFITTHPMNASVSAGLSVQFTASSSSSFPVCQWQRDSAGIFVNLVNNSTYSGVHTSTLTVNNVPVSMNNQQFRCIMTSGYCQAVTNAATLSVGAGVLPEDAGPIHGPGILCFGDTTQISINPVNYANGYTWSVSGNANIIGAQNTNSLTLQIFDTLVNVSVTPINGFGSGNSSSIIIHAHPMPTGILSGNPVICQGDSAVLTMSVTGDGSWFGVINDSITFAGNTNTFNVVVHPDSTTYYVLNNLYTIDGCVAYPDLLSSTASVTVLPTSTDTVHVSVCQVQLPYLWQGLSITSPGYFNDTLTNVAGCDSIVTLHLSLIPSVAPLAPSSISQALISNTCFNRVYRYTAAVTANATGYQWLIPASCGGVSGVTVDSGDINTSRIIKLKYYSNNAAFLTDSIKVRAYNTCSYGPFKSAKLINTMLNPPLIPSSITITPLVTNVCGERKYRFNAPSLPGVTLSNTAATGYLWSFSSPLPLQAQIDSGTYTSKTIVVKFVSNNASNVTDSIFLHYSSACGYSPKKAMRLTISSISAPLSPAFISSTSLSTSICGNRRYRYSMPVLPVATSSNTAATGYLWTLVGRTALYGIVDSGSLTSRVFILKYTDNEATTIGDSIKAQFSSSCGLSAAKAIKFSVPKLSAPYAPSWIVVTAVTPNVCGSRIYRYTAPLLPAATTTTSAATGYEWSFTGNLGSNAMIDSGTVNSKVIRVLFTSGAGALAGDSVKLRYSSSCGYSTYRAMKLTNTLLANCIPMFANRKPVSDCLFQEKILAALIRTNVYRNRIIK